MNRTRGFAKIYVSTRNIYIVEKIKLQSDATLLQDTDRREEDRMAVLEYELRTARETITQLRLETIP